MALSNGSKLRPASSCAFRKILAGLEEPEFYRLLSLPCWEQEKCRPAFEDGQYYERMISILSKGTEYQIGAYFIGNVIVANTSSLEHLVLLTNLFEKPSGTVPGQGCPPADQDLRLHDYSVVVFDEGAIDHIAQVIATCTEGGLVVFDFMPTSPASHLVGGEDTLVYGIRNVRSYPNKLYEVDLSSTVQVDDIEVLITEADEQRAREELQSLVDKAGVEIVSARPSNYEHKITHRGQDFWNEAMDESPLDSMTWAVGADKHRRRHVNRVFNEWRANGTPDAVPASVMYSMIVSVRKKSEQWCCEICEKVKSTEANLKRHKNKRHYGCTYGCTFTRCDERYSKCKNWNRHEVSQHFLSEMWRCNFDGRQDDPDLGKKCSRLCHDEQGFAEHLQADHGIGAGTEESKAQCSNMRLGRDGHYNFWCGFCDNIIKQKGIQLDAYDVRSKHIRDHFEKDHCRIGDWIDVERNKKKASIE